MYPSRKMGTLDDPCDQMRAGQCGIWELLSMEEKALSKALDEKG